MLRHLVFLVCLGLLGWGCTKPQTVRQEPPPKESTPPTSTQTNTVNVSPNAPPAFAHGEQLFASYQEQKLQPYYRHLSAFQQDLKRKATAFQSAHKAFRQLYEKEQVTRWKLASYSRAGDLHVDFGQAFYKAPPIDLEDQSRIQLKRILLQRGVPRRLHANAIKQLLPTILAKQQRQFKVRMVRLGNHFVQQGVKLYRKSIELAEEHNLPNPWSKKSAKKLKQIRPHLFQLPPPTRSQSSRKKDYKQLPFPWLH